MTLHLVRLRPDLPRLVAFAAAARVLPRGGDLGYAIHLALRRALGTAAPQPFRLIEPTGELYGYAGDAAALEAAAALPAMTAEIESARAALAIDGLAIRPMPTEWRRGARYRAEVRLRPVRRTGKDKRRPDRPGEHDAFGLAVRGLPPDQWPAPQQIYLGWTRQKLKDGGAEPLDDLRLVAMTRTEVMRRRHAGPGAACRCFDGPDITVAGTVAVADPAAFAALLARGVGRHRAFGFGMMLLRPA